MEVVLGPEVGDLVRRVHEEKATQSGFAVVDPAEVARGNQTVNMHVPQGGTVLRLVLTEQSSN
jgi:hypothetical protein